MVVKHLYLSKGLEVMGLTQSCTGSTLPALQALQNKADKWIQSNSNQLTPKTSPLGGDPSYYIAFATLPTGVTTFSP